MREKTAMDMWEKTAMDMHISTNASKLGLEVPICARWVLSGVS